MDTLIRTAAPAVAPTTDIVDAARESQTPLQHDGDLEIIIVDDRQLIRECLGRSLLVVEPTLAVTYLAKADEFDALGPQVPGRPRVVLINITPSNGIDLVLEQMLRIKSIDRAVNIVVLSETDRSSNIQQVIGNGASGYIPANIGLKVAMRAMQLVAAGGIYLPASILAACGQDAQQEKGFAKEGERPKNTFTSKQMAVIEALRRGKANKIIAYELNMCESTVKVHVRNVMKKLRAKNRTEVAYMLNENNNGVSTDAH